MIYPIRNIVAGIADLDPGDLVLREAISLGDRLQATVHLVHGYEVPPLMWEAYGRMGYMTPHELDHYGESVREHLESVAAESGASPSLTTRAVAGSAATAGRSSAGRLWRPAVAVMRPAAPSAPDHEPRRRPSSTCSSIQR